jgi:Mn2+/Fe2+ NRAMP family transporter
MKGRFLFTFGPGLLVAATGVGAGDLATAALAGSELGLACLWTVLAGAGLKYALTEGLARWQLAQGSTFLEATLERLGRPVRAFFLAYLVLWSYFVAAALIGAAGVALHALVPCFEDPARGKAVFGLLQSLIAVLIVRRGGYRGFELAMQACVGAMFATVVVSALLFVPDWGELVRGLFVPTLAAGGAEGRAWIVAMIGGVGGTVTILAYGYWIREEGRQGLDKLGVTRLDLALGYAVTALFGLAMVILGSTIEVHGQGLSLILDLAARLEEPLGAAGRYAFLLGAWGAIYSSLLGVWQAVPYLFCDVLHALRGRRAAADPRSVGYRYYLYALALVPALGLGQGFAGAQRAYALVGAAFLPLLAAALLAGNGRRAGLGAARNGLVSSAVLWLCLAFFLYAGLLEVREAWR